MTFLQVPTYHSYLYIPVYTCNHVQSQVHGQVDINQIIDSFILT